MALGDFAIECLNLPQNVLSDHILDYFISEVINNQRNRYCYLQHLALFQLLQDSKSLRELSRERELAPKFFRVIPEYLIRLDEIEKGSPVVMQLEN